MARDWAEVGLRWEAEEVSKQFGDHATDRAVVAIAQLPIVVDVDKLEAAGVDVLAWLNASNSMRVRAQAIGRKRAKKDDDEVVRERVFSALQGQRMVGGKTVTIVKHPLPDGTMYEGNDEMEYRQLYAVCLVDQGVPAETATGIAGRAGWE